MNTTNAIFQRLGQNYLSDNKEALGIQKINSWALSRLYNNTIKQRQTQKDKTLYTYLQWKNIQSIQNSTALRKKKTELTKTSASVYEVQALQWLDRKAEV